MEASRRKWLKQVGIILAAAGMPRLEVVASPVMEPASFTPPTSDSPIRLSSNENPYGPSPIALQTMAEALGLSNRYQWEMIRTLKTAIAAKNNLTDSNVMIGAGSTQIIDTAIRFAALQKGSFVMADPTFNHWVKAAEKSGLQKISVPLSVGKVHNLTAMLQAIKKDTRMVYICNPNNPTGTVCKNDALLSFVKEAAKQTLVVVDEAYIEYSGEQSLAKLVTENENLVVIRTFSKIYGLAGARIGYALAHANTINQLTEIESGANVATSAVSMAASLASLKDNAFVKDSLTKNEKAKAYTIQQLERLNIKCIPSHTNFIYFSLANYKNDFFARLKAGNIQGTKIYEDDGKWSRITIGTMQEMQEFIAALE